MAVLEDYKLEGLTISEDKLSFKFVVPDTTRIALKSTEAWTVDKTKDEIKYYEITVLSQTDAVGVGLASPDFPSEGQMPGWLDNSYGYHSDDGKRFFGARTQAEFGPTYGAGDTVGLGLKQSTGEVFATINGKLIGLIASDLQLAQYRPVIGANNSCEVHVNFNGPFKYDVSTFPLEHWKILDAKKIANHGGVVLFVDGLEEAAAETLKKEVEAIALEFHHAKDELKFYFAHSNDGGTRAFRNFVLGGNKPALVIYNPTDKKKYVLQHDGANAITTASAKEFIKAYKDGSANPYYKSEARPVGDKNPAHPSLTKLVGESFRELVLQNNKDVLVDVYADWCGPCVALAPAYAILADVLEGNPNIVIAKIDKQVNDLDTKYFPETFIPNIKLFPANDKENPINYNGDRSVENFLAFVHQHANVKFDLEAAQAKVKVVKALAHKKELKNVTHVESVEEYNTLLKTDKLVVVDFFATWCPPCKFIAPIFAELSEQYLNVVFLKVNVDELKEVSALAGITCMPTFQYYKGGVKVDTLEGADQGELVRLITQHSS